MATEGGSGERGDATHLASREAGRKGPSPQSVEIDDRSQWVGDWTLIHFCNVKNVKNFN